MVEKIQSIIDGTFINNHWGNEYRDYIYGNSAEKGHPLFETKDETDSFLRRAQEDYNRGNYKNKDLYVDWNSASVIFLEEGQSYNLFDVHGKNDGYHGSEKRKPIDNRGRVHLIVTI